MASAGVVELVDTQVLGTCDFGRGGSSPFTRTIIKRNAAMLRCIAERQSHNVNYIECLEF